MVSKLNNKGMTSVELLITFTILSMVVVGMLNNVLHYKDREQRESIKSSVVEYEEKIQKTIQDDLIKKHLTKADIDNNQPDKIDVSLEMDNNYKTSLIIDFDKNKILYGEMGNTISYPIPKLNYNDSDLLLNQDESYAKIIGTDKSFLKIKIAFTHPDFSLDELSFYITCPINYPIDYYKHKQLTGIVTLNKSSDTYNIIESGIIEYTVLDNYDILNINVYNNSNIDLYYSLYYYDDDLPNNSNIGYLISDYADLSSDEISSGKIIKSSNDSEYNISIIGMRGKKLRIGVGITSLSTKHMVPDEASEFKRSDWTGQVVKLSTISTLNKTDSEQTFITGTNPNNYIWYSGKLWRAVSINPSDNSVKLVTQWNISALPYNSSNNTTFNDSYMKQWLNDTSVDGFLGNLREYNKFIKTNSTWNATLTEKTTKPASTTMIQATVGLLNAYEYTMSYKNATTKTGYLNNGLFWWLLTPYDSKIVRHIDLDGNCFGNSPLYSYGARPSINLKPEIKIISGNGSADNPYRLYGDNDTPPSGTLLSNRYSGEYIRFGTGKNNLYRIVSHENGTGTKITSAISLSEDSGYKTIAFGNDSTFSSSNTIGTFLNGEYLKNNSYLTSEQVNMIADNTVWYLGRVGSGVSYKLTKYKNVSTSELTTNTTTAKIGLLRLGELMSGQFDKNGNNASYWLLTPYVSPLVRNTYFQGVGSNNNSSELYNIRPTMNLKSNVIITGGNGTKNSPFTVSVK